jgi:hypothetical protein
VILALAGANALQAWSLLDAFLFTDTLPERHSSCYVFSTALPSAAAFLAPFVGVAAALAYWGMAWVAFSHDVHALTKKCAAGVHAGATQPAPEAGVNGRRP